MLRFLFWGEDMRNITNAIGLTILLGLTGCELAADPDTLTGTYRRPDSQEMLILRKDGTAILRNRPGKEGDIVVKWSRYKSNDKYDCTWLDFEPIDSRGIEWHTCANRILVRDTVFIGHPDADPDESDSFYEKVK